MDTLIQYVTHSLGGSFVNTGGGCMAIEIRLDDDETYGAHIMVSDREDTFVRGDWHSNDMVEGFSAFYYAPGYGDTHDDAVEIYVSEFLDRDDETNEIDPGALALEARRVVAAVRAFRATLEG